MKGTGLDVVHVPYKGAAAPATAAALGGEIAFAQVGAPALMAHLASDLLVALGGHAAQAIATAARRADRWRADRPHGRGDFVAWYGLPVPSHTPADVVQQLEKTALAVLKRPEGRTKFTALGTDVVAMPSAQFAERMRAESKHYGEIINRFKIQATQVSLEPGCCCYAVVRQLTLSCRRASRSAADMARALLKS